MRPAQRVAVGLGLMLLLVIGASASAILVVDHEGAPGSAGFGSDSPWSVDFSAAPVRGQPPPIPVSVDLPGYASPAYITEPGWVLTKHVIWALGTGALKHLDGSGLSRIGKGTTGFGVVAGTLIFATEKGIEAGEIAVPREDAFFTEQLLVIGGDAVRLRELHAQGVDLATDPEAIAIHHRAVGRTRQLEARSFDGSDALWGAIANNGRFVMTQMAINEASSWALGKTLQRLGLTTLSEDASPGDVIHQLIGKKGPLRSTLKAIGWTRFDMRANWGREFANAMTSHALGEASKQVLKAFLDDLLDRGWKANRDVLVSNPSHLRVFAARAAVPIAVAAAAHPRAAALVRTIDPVVQAVATDDFLVHLPSNQSDRGNADRSRAGEQSRQAIEQATDDPMPAWRIAYREKLKIAGDGKTFAICSGATWDGGRGEKPVCK